MSALRHLNGITRLLSWLVLTLAFRLWGADPLPGERARPWGRAFMPQDYGGDAQVGAVMESPWGTMLFASGRKIIEFDGSAWRADETPVAHIRAIVDAGGGRIVIAGTGGFGMLSRRASGGCGAPTRGRPGSARHAGRWSTRGLGGRGTLRARYARRSRRSHAATAHDGHL